MGRPKKKTRKKVGNKKKQGGSAEDSKPHAAGVIEKTPNLSAIEESGTVIEEPGTPVEEPGAPSLAPQRRRSGSFDCVWVVSFIATAHSSGHELTDQFSSFSSQPNSPTDASKTTPDVCTSTDAKDGDSGMGYGKGKWGEKTEGVVYESGAYSDTEDSGTEGACKQRDLSYLVKAKAMLEHNTKVMEKIAKLVGPTYDSDQEEPVASKEEPVASNEDEIEWVTGEVQGYKYKVRKELAEKVKQMDRFELLQDIIARKRRIAMKLARNRKAMGALTGFAKLNL